MASFVQIVGIAVLPAALTDCALVSSLDGFGSGECSSCATTVDGGALRDSVADGDAGADVATTVTGQDAGGPPRIDAAQLDVNTTDADADADAAGGDVGTADVADTGNAADARLDAPDGDASDGPSTEAGCLSGYTSCNGACVDEQTDSTNCGGCGAGHACTGSATCHAGVCCTQVLLPPSVNVDATQWTSNYPTSPIWNCSAAGTTTIDSAAGTVTSTSCALGTLDVSNGMAQSVAGGPTVMVVRLRGLTVTNNHVIHITGDKPVIFLVAGNVVVDSGGRIDAGAVGSTAGPGGSLAANCAGSTGSNGSASDTGAGGGGFGTAGGTGKTKDNLAGGAGGAPSSVTNLQPLRGGCAGGIAANGYSPGGAGGGAFEISASGMVTIGTGANSAILSAAGGGSPAAKYQYAGSGGAGSGGGILLVAPSAPALGASGSVRVHGGGAGSGAGIHLGGTGQDGHVADDTAASGGAAGDPWNATGGNGGLCSGSDCSVASGAGAAGQAASNNDVGSGGGGGGGRVQITTGAATAVCN